MGKTGREERTEDRPVENDEKHTLNRQEYLPEKQARSKGKAHKDAMGEDKLVQDVVSNVHKAEKPPKQDSVTGAEKSAHKKKKKDSREEPVEDTVKKKMQEEAAAQEAPVEPASASTAQRSAAA